MNFSVIYHHLVIKEDIPKLSSETKLRIQSNIENKLMIDPAHYGKPLRKSLKGYRKLRVGNYRVIFRIEETTLKIFIIQHRSVVYKKIDARL